MCYNVLCVDFTIRLFIFKLSYNPTRINQYLCFIEFHEKIRYKLKSGYNYMMFLKCYSNFI